MLCNSTQNDEEHRISRHSLCIDNKLSFALLVVDHNKAAPGTSNNEYQAARITKSAQCSDLATAELKHLHNTRMKTKKQNFRLGRGGEGVGERGRRKERVREGRWKEVERKREG